MDNIVGKFMTVILILSIKPASGAPRGQKKEGQKVGVLRMGSLSVDLTPAGCLEPMLHGVPKPPASQSPHLQHLAAANDGQWGEGSVLNSARECPSALQNKHQPSVPAVRPRRRGTSGQN